jgi:hypothetical protein
MDQNSTNGPGPDKRNWRERLGIGAKEMPKLSDEFRDGSVNAQPGAAAAAAPRGAQPVTKPAPMAPRAPKPASGGTSAEAAPPPQPAPASRATPRMPDNATQDALAEKLRAQRAAAERLAEQRVQAARDRAEGRVPPPEPPRQPAAQAPRTPPSPSPKPRAPVPPPPPGRPKFSFAEEPASAPRASEAPAGRPGMSTGAPLTPPRPALGGDRGQPPFLRPSAPGIGGSRPQTPYRPVDPAANYGAPPRLQPPPARGGGFGGEAPAPGYGGPRSAPRRPPALDAAYPRAPEPRDYPEAEQEEVRQAPRLGRPTRGRSQDDFDEVFEDDGGGRQRPSARDYQSAYGESEDAFAEDQRRSSGPWLLLLALLAAALITGGVVWYYNSGMGNVAGTGEAPTEVPVVNAPAEPPKVEPEPQAGGGEQPAAQRKLIYDRIVGEQEVLGGAQMQPTEEIPVEPASAGTPPSEVPAVPENNQIPAPDAQMQGTETDGMPTVDEPPPLPLPPADQQGNLRNNTGPRIAATSAEVEQGATAPPAPRATAVPAPPSPSTSSVALLPPPPETATDGAALVSGTAASAEPAAQMEPPETQSGAGTETVETEEPAPPPKKKPAATAKKPKPPQDNMENLGSEPVVLVPPAQPVSDDTQTASNTPVAPAVEAEPPAEKRPRSIMDLFRGAGGNDDPPPATELAAVEQEKPARPARRQQQTQQEQPQPETQAQQPVTGSGFVVQLASFRSEAEARKEYNRLSNLYPQVVGGLQQQIRQTSVGGSTRYQLGLGPLPSRSDATRVCSQLITAGESDCIVRGR